MTIQKPKILHENIYESPGTIIITSELAGFPKERLRDRRFHDKWAPTGAGDQVYRIEVDSPPATAPNTVILGGHNLGAEGTTVRLRSADDSDTG